MHVEVALVLGGVGAVAALEVHVVRVSPRLQRTFALMGVLDMVLQVLLPPECSLTELALQIVLVHVVAHFTLEG